jgi:3-hydroxybutyryl-CoA dehydrogenase
MTETVGVVGAGTMGMGIAQVAAVAGHRVLITDAADGAAARAVVGIRDRVKAEVARGRLIVDPEALDLTPVDSVTGLDGCAVVVEAVVEDLAVKRALFAELENVVAGDAMLASNTSSLSPTTLAAGLRHPERLVGLHFFNPVPAMRLVEVISGLATAPAVAAAAAALAAAWGKTVVRSTATPGFIVNRVARPFYAEAWRVYEEHAAAAEAIDAVLTGAGGFRMGPFALMDLIGHDVNEAVTRSVWSAFGYDSRFAPSLAQRAMVEAGWLGRKAGRGVYPAEGAPVPVPAAKVLPPDLVTEHPVPAEGNEGTVPSGSLVLSSLVARAGVRSVPAARDAAAVAGLPVPAGGLVELPSGVLLALCNGITATALAGRLGRPVVVVDRVLDPATASAIAVASSDGCPERAVADAVGLLQAAGLDVYVVGDTPGLVVTRTVAMLANLAFDAMASRVASEPDIETAMRLGVNYPLGPLAWARQWGTGTVLRVLDHLEDWYRDGHYRASSLLRQAVLTERIMGDR